MNLPLWSLSSLATLVYSSDYNFKHRDVKLCDLSLHIKPNKRTSTGPILYIQLFRDF